MRQPMFGLSLAGLRHPLASPVQGMADGGERIKLRILNNL